MYKSINENLYNFSFFHHFIQFIIFFLQHNHFVLFVIDLSPTNIEINKQNY